MNFLRQHTRPEADDAALIREYKTEGRLDTLAVLYQRYMELVYGVCLKYLDAETARDEVMLIFEELIIKLKQHEVQNFKSWLHVLTRNHCLMKLRAAKGREGLEVSFDDRPVMENGENFHHEAETGPSLENNLQAMEKCLETLPDEQKRSVDLFYLQEKSYREVEAITGYDLKKVKSYIQNGKRNLKLCMEKQAV
ncbi:sigma-70 family RNA polymerase sigma factor [Chitinophaga horti]|uniref:Sigma-70 family RNA polymerase sigma factor n=1 Tax=Chitinophaga horti TaxID=2920382 RepID=A0ABY6J010_9BACT|nr:sigma-70 family RNA polymerase sigma factor [Chitinophaga horti]UYQ93004.1 sigma-70 family RNA polymerase sigma factor [Chitinophaga horti]